MGCIDVLEHYLDMVGVTGSNPVPRTIGVALNSKAFGLEALILRASAAASPFFLWGALC